jgi:curved DNA-binding protein CbpA
MTAINAAWEILGEPAARQAFDRERNAAAARGHGASGASSARPAAGSSPTPARPASTPARPTPAPPPEVVSRDWTSGRSSQGGGFDESMRAAEGLGAAGPPPGRPSGSLLNFGRYAGWSLGEVARHDIEYIEWLDRAPIGRNYRQELDDILRASGRRRSADGDAADRRGIYRRR